MTKEIKKIRSAPNSKESEMMVLGCMLTNINSLNTVCDGLISNDFYYTEHQIIFKVILELYRKDKPADIHIVSEELKKIEKLSYVGGISYLTTLAQYVGTSAYIEEYIKLVKEKAVLRKMIDTAQEIEKKAIEESEDVFTLLDTAQSKFYHISQASSSTDSISIKDLITGTRGEAKLPYLKILEDRQEKYRELGEDGVKFVGIPTHFIDLDKLINGFNPSNLMILAARPAMGKTSMAINVAENICFRNNIPVGIFSLEMSAEQLLHRIICSQSEVESEKILTGSLNGHEYQRIVACINSMQKHTLLIDDQPGLKITDLRSRARRMKESYNIGFLVIDYLQLISGSGSNRSNESRQIEISEVSRMLKNLARELDIPILCLSQLSRRVEERQGHRPMMSDLRESGCLTGDVIIKDAETEELHTIKELAQRKNQTPIMIYAIDQNLKLGKHKLIKAFYSGQKTVYQLMTKSKRSIKASANHKFRTTDGWERLDQLHVGEELAIFDRENLNEPLDFDEIILIEKLQKEDVYDATVENVHNFVANDIIVHNSLEQDSDLVMFLLRPEYYDPYDRPSQAELIIAKNRHGSVGTVNLTFRKELAQFANFTPTNSQDLDSNEDAFSEFSPE
jgi:replicative DNA helicase